MHLGLCGLRQDYPSRNQIFLFYVFSLHDSEHFRSLLKDKKLDFAIHDMIIQKDQNFSEENPLLHLLIMDAKRFLYSKIALRLTETLYKILMKRDFMTNKEIIKFSKTSLTPVMDAFFGPYSLDWVKGEKREEVTQKMEIEFDSVSRRRNSLNLDFLIHFKDMEYFLATSDLINCSVYKFNGGSVISCIQKSIHNDEERRLVSYARIGNFGILLLLEGGFANWIRITSEDEVEISVCFFEFQPNRAHPNIRILGQETSQKWSSLTSKEIFDSHDNTKEGKVLCLCSFELMGPDCVEDPQKLMHKDRSHSDEIEEKSVDHSFDLIKRNNSDSIQKIRFGPLSFSSKSNNKNASFHFKLGRRLDFFPNRLLLQNYQIQGLNSFYNMVDYDVIVCAIRDSLVTGSGEINLVFYSKKRDSPNFASRHSFVKAKKKLGLHRLLEEIESTKMNANEFEDSEIDLDYLRKSSNEDSMSNSNPYHRDWRSMRQDRGPNLNFAIPKKIWVKRQPVEYSFHFPTQMGQWKQRYEMYLLIDYLDENSETRLERLVSFTFKLKVLDQEEKWSKIFDGVSFEDIEEESIKIHGDYFNRTNFTSSKFCRLFDQRRGLHKLFDYDSDPVGIIDESGGMGIAYV